MRIAAEKVVVLVDRACNEPRDLFGQGGYGWGSRIAVVRSGYARKTTKAIQRAFRKAIRSAI